MSFLSKVVDAGRTVGQAVGFIAPPATITHHAFLEAVANGNTKIVEIGLKTLKSLDPKDFEQSFKWEWKQESGGGRLFRSCITEYNKCNALVIAGLSNQNGILELLLKDPKGIKLLNLVDENGSTPLHYIAKKTDTQAAILKLCEAGAATNIRNLVGLTPLDSAAYGNLEAVKTLLFCIQPTKQKLSGNDLSEPLRIALSFANFSPDSYYAQETISVLLENGADPSVKLDLDGFPGNLLDFAKALELSKAIIEMLEAKIKSLNIVYDQKPDYDYKEEKEERKV